MPLARIDARNPASAPRRHLRSVPASAKPDEPVVPSGAAAERFALAMSVVTLLVVVAAAFAYKATTAESSALLVAAGACVLAAVLIYRFSSSWMTAELELEARMRGLSGEAARAGADQAMRTLVDELQATPQERQAAAPEATGAAGRGRLP